MNEGTRLRDPSVHRHLEQELLKQEKTITYLRNLLKKKDNEIIELKESTQKNESLSQDFTQLDNMVNTNKKKEMDYFMIKSLKREIEEFKHRIQIVEGLSDKQSTQQPLILQSRVTGKQVIPKGSFSYKRACAKSSVLLPAKSVGATKLINDKTDNSETSIGSENVQCEIQFRLKEESLSETTETPSDGLTPRRSHTSGTIISEKEREVLTPELPFNEKESLHKRYIMLDTKLIWWREEMKASLELIAKLKMAVNLNKEEEIESNELDQSKEKICREINTDSGKMTTSSSLASLYPEPFTQNSDVAYTFQTSEPLEEIDGLSKTLRVTRKECQFWENQFLQILVENVEIRAFFSGTHISENTTSLHEELQGRIDGLDSAISCLQKRNEELAVQINEKDRSLVDSLKDNLSLQSQLKRTDDCLRETILRVAAEKNALKKRMDNFSYLGRYENSPYAVNSHIKASFVKRRRHILCPRRNDRGQLTASSSCSTLPQTRFTDEALVEQSSPPSRKRSESLRREQSARRKSSKLIEYARTRLREMKPGPPRSADRIFNCKREINEGPKGFGSWGIPDSVLRKISFDESNKNQDVPDIMIL